MLYVHVVRPSSNRLRPILGQLLLPPWRRSDYCSPFRGQASVCFICEGFLELSITNVGGFKRFNNLANYSKNFQFSVSLCSTSVTKSLLVKVSTIDSFVSVPTITNITYRVNVHVLRQVYYSCYTESQETIQSQTLYTSASTL